MKSGGASCDEVGFYPVHPAHPVEKSAFNRRIRIVAKSSDSRGVRLLSVDHEARSLSKSGSHLGSQTRPEQLEDRMNRIYRMKSGGASCDEVGFYPVHPAHPVEKSGFNRRIRIVAKSSGSRGVRLLSDDHEVRCLVYVRDLPSVFDVAAWLLHPPLQTHHVCRHPFLPGRESPAQRRPQIERRFHARPLGSVRENRIRW